MMRHHRWSNASVAALLCASLVGCGGGGGDSDSDPDSFWTLGDFTYINSGQRAVSASTLNGRTLSVLAVSTTSRAANASGNGAYAGSSIDISLFYAGPGTYTVLPSKLALLSADPSIRGIVVETTVGTASTAGAVQYTAQSGTLEVVPTGDGKWRFSTTAPIPTVATLQVLGGIEGAPATATLVVRDVF